MKNVLILNLCNKKDSLHVLEFIKPIETIIKKVTSKYEIKHHLEKIHYISYSHIIICGVPLKDFEYEQNLDTFSWIKNYTGNLLGICAGAQVLSQTYGNTLSELQEIGLQKIEKNKNDVLIDEFTFPLEIYGLHNNSFGTLDNFNIILQGKIPEMIKHKTKNHYGCLFHPEVRNHKLIENFINL